MDKRRTQKKKAPLPSGGRIPLKAIQPVAGKKNASTVYTRPDKVKQEPVKSLHVNRVVPEIPNEDEVMMLTAEEPTRLYYKMLCEERRLALVDALEENKKLHEKVQDLTEDVKRLEEKSDSAQYFATLYLTLKREIDMKERDHETAQQSKRPRLGRQF